MMTDPISDMLTRIRNAQLALHKDVAIPYSKIKYSIANILKEEGYISDLALNNGTIMLYFKYYKGKAAIEGLRRISKSGRRVYVSTHDIPSVQNGLGICILSTSIGVIDCNKARYSKVGGELLCEIW